MIGTLSPRSARTTGPGSGAALAVRISPSTRAVGFWSALLATVFSVTYIVGQLAEWLGWLGSQGGP